MHFKADFSVIFRKNIKIEQFSQQTCRPRLMFAASQTSSVFTLLMLTLEHFHADNSLSDWIYEVLLANPFSPKMSVGLATDAYKRPVLDHFHFGGHLEQRIYNEDNDK